MRRWHSGQLFSVTWIRRWCDQVFLDFFDRKHSQNSLLSYYIPSIVSTQIPFTLVLSPRILLFLYTLYLSYYFYIFNILFQLFFFFLFLIKSFQIPVPVILFPANWTACDDISDTNSIKNWHSFPFRISRSISHKRAESDFSSSACQNLHKTSRARFPTASFCTASPPPPLAIIIIIIHFTSEADHCFLPSLPPHASLILIKKMKGSRGKNRRKVINYWKYIHQWILIKKTD